MEFTETEARWFIGIAIILGCAFVALLCDYLKGVNERLRERTMELLARAEEARAIGGAAQDSSSDRAAILAAVADMRRDMERALKDLADRKAPAAPAAALAVASPPEPPARTPEREPEAAPVPVVEDLPQRPTLPPLQPAIAPLLAATTAPRPTSAPVIPLESPKPLELPKRVAKLPGMQETLARVVPPNAESVPDNVVKIRVLRNQQPFETEVQAQSPRLPEPVAEVPVAPLAEASVPVPSNDPWTYRPAQPQPEELPEPLTPMPPPLPTPELTQPVAEVVPEAVEAPESAPEEANAAPEEPVAAASTPAPAPTADGSLALPSGMHDRPTLDFLLADPTPFTGLVVSIGINDFAQIEASSGKEAANELAGSITNLVKSLTANLGAPDHFACRSANDEFVICYNGEIGPVAQRRMSALSERLWDFQLRSMGTFSVVFSWGATEANEESLADAIDAANERMRETRQNRASMGGRGNKRVVA